MYDLGQSHFQGGSGKKGRVKTTLPLLFGSGIWSLFLNGYSVVHEGQIDPKNSTRKSVHCYSLEKYVLGFDMITQNGFPPIRYRVLRYSHWVLSSLREDSDELIALFLIECV